MLNKIFLQGRLVADPELRTTPNGISTTSFRIAVDRDFKDRETGEKKADFFSVVTWRQTAEFVSRYFTKGRMAIVEGRIQNREYTDRDGNRRFITEVVADNVYFGDSRRDSEGGGYAPAPVANKSYGSGSYNSAAPASYPTAPAADQFADLTDDDGELPF